MNSSIDKLTKEMLKNSLLEVPDPDFNTAIMNRVLRESRKQRMLDNIVLCSLLFVAVDALIFVILWLTDLNIFDLAIRVFDAPREILVQVGNFKNSIIVDGLIIFAIAPFGTLMAILTIVESKLNLPVRPKRREK